MTKFRFSSETEASKMRGRFASLAAVVAIVLAHGVAFPAAAEDKAAAGKGDKTETAAAPNLQPWMVSCASAGADDALACTVSQTLVAKQTAQRVLTVTVAKDPNSRDLVATLGLPHGLSLTEGVEVFVDDGKPTRYPIVTADQNGSYAKVPLNGDRLAELKRGSILNVRVRSANNAEIVMQISLAGFTAATAKI